MEKKKKRGKYGQYNVSTMGTPTTLTTEVIQEIRNYVLDGKSDAEIQEILSIPQQTWSTWRTRNHLDFAVLLNQWQQEYIVRVAQRELAKLVNDSDSRVKLDALKFALERLNKKEYSPRQETKELPKEEKLEEKEQERIKKLLGTNKKDSHVESNSEPITTYEEVTVK